VTISLKDGTALNANIRYSTQDHLDVQLYDQDGRLGTDIRRIARADIASIEYEKNFVMTVHKYKWYLAGACGIAVLIMVASWFSKDEISQWMQATWDFSLMIIPLLFGGVFVTGFVGALMPERYVAGLVGGNSRMSNLVASLVGMFWYFATLTEVPIVEMLPRLGMGKGPALALLLAGPALSLPSILVIYRIIGALKTLVLCVLVVVMSSIADLAFGALF
jgi:uncharacterized membrane protein YraQ (UPF0718 family)